jgi:hypothetical protein
MVQESKQEKFANAEKLAAEEAPDGTENDTKNVDL